jgi:hypothetical protein
MGYPSILPEMGLQFFHILLYCMVYIFGGAALIGLAVYIALVGSEILFSQPRAKTRHAKVAQSGRRAGAAEVSLVLSAAKAPVLAEAEGRGSDTALPVLPVGTEMLPIVPVTLERDSSGL